MTIEQVKAELEARYVRHKGDKIWFLKDDSFKIKGKAITRVVFKTRSRAHKSIRSHRYHYMIRHALYSDHRHSGSYGASHDPIIVSWWD